MSITSASKKSRSKKPKPQKNHSMNAIQIATTILAPAAEAVGAKFMFGKRWESALATIKESTDKWIHIEAVYSERVSLSQRSSSVTFSGLVVTQDRVDSAPTTARDKAKRKSKQPREVHLKDMWDLYIDFLDAIRANTSIQVLEFVGTPAIQIFNVMTGYIIEITIVSRHTECS